MKKLGLFGFSVLLFLGIGSNLYSQNNISIDEAIKTGANAIEERLPGIKLVVLNFRSASDRFSTYVLEELMTHLVTRLSNL